MTRSQPTSSGASSALVGASVLVVDDESHIRLMLRTILDAEGCKVAEAANGREALDLIHNQAFDVMILDLNMRVIDGMTVLQQMKEKPPHHAPRVLVLTAYGSTAVAVRATRLGALDFLEKPASPDEVREAVAAILSEPQPAVAHPSESDTEGGYEAVIRRVQAALRASNVSSAESLLMKAADLAQHDAAYFNLLGVIYEMRRQWRLAKKFYGKAMRADRQFQAAEQNLRRIYELYTFGRSREPVALGDESNSTSPALDELLRKRATEP